MKNKFDSYQDALKNRLEQNHYRQLRCVLPLDEANMISQEKRLVNFASNDYLGLSKHAFIKQNTIKYLLQLGVGSTASRFLPHHLEYHQEIEERLAHMLGTETSLLFPAGFHVNQSIISTLANARSTLFIDRFCHTSLMQGAQNSGAKISRFEHNDLKHLDNLLTQAAQAGNKIIVTESLFHHEGDKAPLKELIELAERHDALLYVDDTHSMGVLGINGTGLSSHRKGIDFVAGNFSKSCGSFGGYIGLSRLMKDYLINFCPSLSGSNALPPAILGAIDALLQLIPDMDIEREELLQKSQWLRHKLYQIGFSTGKSCSHIIPIMIGEEKEAHALFEMLNSEGILTILVKPPMVPPNSARLRIALNAHHTEEQMTKLLYTLQSLRHMARPFTAINS